MPYTDQRSRKKVSPLSAPADQAIDDEHPHSVVSSNKPKPETQSKPAPDTNMQTMKKYTRHQGQNINLKVMTYRQSCLGVRGQLTYPIVSGVECA